MAKYNFIKHLEKIKKDFLKYAKENSHELDMQTFEIDICNCYLLLRIEGEDSDGDCVVFEQEIEIDNTETYQNKLLPLSIQELH